jgi:hypothetical protein
VLSKNGLIQVDEISLMSFSNMLINFNGLFVCCILEHFVKFGILCLFWLKMC